MMNLSMRPDALILIYMRYLSDGSSLYSNLQRSTTISDWWQCSEERPKRPSDPFTGCKYCFEHAEEVFIVHSGRVYVWNRHISCVTADDCVGLVFPSKLFVMFVARTVPMCLFAIQADGFPFIAALLTHEA